MKKVVLFVICAAYLQIIHAQFPMGGGAPGGRTRGAGGPPAIGHFYGRIVDNKSNKGLEAVSVQLLQNKFDSVNKKRIDAVIAGMLTNAHGDFSLENLPLFGQFKLKITGIGYKTIEQSVKFDMKMPTGGGGDGQSPDMSQALAGIDKDLGNIKLEEDAKVLEAVTVTGSKPLIEMGIDRKIINVEKNITATGGTAVDVMRSVPSVNVDIDGNVTMRNAAPQIFVDGRPTTLSLDQIPADAIQSVELITNPSAKYDASGGQAGILNIVLKKNRKAGYNGSIRAGIDSRAKINAGGDINVRQGKINLFANAMYNQRKSKGWGETVIDNFSVNPPYRSLNTNDGIFNGAFGFGRFGLDYFMDNRNTISISQSIVNGDFRFDNTNNYIFDTASKFWQAQTRNTLGKNNFRNYGTQLSFKHIFTKPGKELTADANFNQSKNENKNNIVDQFYSDAAQQSPTFQRKSVIDGGGGNKFFVGQMDYVNPITENTKWEAGIRAQVRNFTSFQRYYDMNGVLQPGQSSDFDYTDYIYAGYATFSQKLKDKFSYQLGLRAESSKYDGEQIGKQRYSNKFPISFFPSVFMTRSFENRQDVQLNYTRRINRPNFFQLMPNVDYTDQIVYSTGNPALTPEFTHSLELSYQKTYGKQNHTFLATLFGKYTTDLIARYQNQNKGRVPQLPDTAMISTWVNASTAWASGLELIFRNNWTKWFEMNVSANIYYSKINGSNVVANLENSRTTWSAKSNNTFKINKGWSIQLSGDYQAKSALPVSTSNSSQGGGRGGFGGGGGGGGFGPGTPSTTQGYINANYGVDLGIRKEFQIKKNTATISANWNDIFRTRRYSSHSESTGFVQDDWRRRDPQIVRVNFSYRFGKFDLSLFKRKNLRGDAEGMQNGMQGIQQ